MSWPTVKKTILLFFLIAILLAQTGCFEYDEKIVLNDDGSGELYVHYQTEKEMKFQNLYFPTDKYEIDYNIKNNYHAAGVENHLRNVIQKEKRTHVYMDFKFNNLTTLASAPRFQNEKFSVSERDGEITLQRLLYFDETQIDRTKLLFKTGLKSLFSQGVLKDIHFRFQWVVPGEITETNATLLGDKNRAIWTITLAEILENRTTQFFLTYKPVEG